MNQLNSFTVFCRWLIQRKGAAYLCYPDGTPMTVVPLAAFEPVAEESHPSPHPRQLPAATYTGNPALDVPLTPPPPEVEVRATYRRRSSLVLCQLVLDTLRVRPMRVKEISVHTRLNDSTVKRVLYKYTGTHFHRDANRYWYAKESALLP